VRAAVVIGSGFEDPDSEPRLALEVYAASSSMRIIGPNCVGTLAPGSSAYLTFSSVLRSATPRPGRIGLVTQSGALGNSLLQTLIRRNVGLAQWVSTGNEVDTGALEIVAGMLAGDNIDTVGLFLEGVTDVGWLPAIEKALQTRGKSLFVLKAAKSSAGRAAAAGHTGRLVGSADASSAILRESGAHELPTLSALADALVLASTAPVSSRPSPTRVSIVTVSGAAGVLAADAVARDPLLSMANAEDASLDELDGRLARTNPVDVPFLDETETFAGVIGRLSIASGTDIVLAVESGLAHDREVLTRALVERRSSTPIVLASLSEDDPVPTEVVHQLAEAGVAYIPTVDRALGATTPPGLFDANAESGSISGHSVHGLEVVEKLVPPSFPWAPWRVLDAGYQSQLDNIDLPVVVKAAGRTIEHRSELGAVEIVYQRACLREAVKRVGEICLREGDVLVVQNVAPPGFEVMVSSVYDPEFGAVAFVRPGGVLAEMMDAQTVLWNAWDPGRRDAVLRSSRLGVLLDGYRGGPKYAIEKLTELVTTCLEISSPRVPLIELNPVVVHTHGVSVLDAVAQIRDNPLPPNSGTGAGSGAQGPERSGPD
jgi:acetate---CoA ligase (ADP-forming)